MEILYVLEQWLENWWPDGLLAAQSIGKVESMVDFVLSIWKTVTFI